MLFKFKKPKAKPIMKMVVPGRRSLGEQWREVTVAVDDSEIKVTANVETAAPANNRPIFVPAMGNLEVEAVDFLLEGARKAQEYSGKNPLTDMSKADYFKWLNAQWIDYVENKLKHLKGQTTIGPGGFNQREAPRRKL